MSWFKLPIAVFNVASPESINVLISTNVSNAAEAPEVTIRATSFDSAEAIAAASEASA